MRDVLVSVIVATYHRDKTLFQALESLGMQTYQPIEIIIISDNASDEWNEKVKLDVDRFSNLFSHIPLQLIINEHNKGSAETRNIGIRAAKGEYITFLDDDDLYLPEKIEKQLLALKRDNSDYGIMDLFLYDEKNKLIDKRIRGYITKTDVNSMLTYHLKYHMTGTDTMMFRKAYLLRIGGFAPINVGDEFYLMERAIIGGGKFCYCMGCEVKAYIHSETEGLSSGEQKIRGENELYSYKKTMWKSLDQKSKRYIRMRHYAVLTFAEVRRKKRYRAIVYMLITILCAPVQCVKMVVSHKGKENRK